MSKEIDNILAVKLIEYSNLERKIRFIISESENAQNLLKTIRMSIVSVLMGYNDKYSQGKMPIDVYYSLLNISSKDLDENYFLMSLPEWINSIKQKKWNWVSSSLLDEYTLEIILQHHSPRGNYEEIICLFFCLNIKPEQILIEDDIFGSYCMKDIPLLPS